MDGAAVAFLGAFRSAILLMLRATRLNPMLLAGDSRVERWRVILFLLCRPVQVREDGFRTTHTPFVIEVEGQKAYAAFPSAEMAMYFVQKLQLDKAYMAVPLISRDPAHLKEAQYAVVLKNHAQVDRLLTGWTSGASFAESLLRLR